MSDGPRMPGGFDPEDMFDEEKAQKGVYEAMGNLLLQGAGLTEADHIWLASYIFALEKTLADSGLQGEHWHGVAHIVYAAVTGRMGSPFSLTDGPPPPEFLKGGE